MIEHFTVLAEDEDLPRWDVPEELAALYGGAIGLDEPCVVANFVESLDGLGPLRREHRSQLRIAVVAGGRVEERPHEPPRRVARARRVEVEPECLEDLGRVALETRPVLRREIAGDFAGVGGKLEDVTAHAISSCVLGARRGRSAIAITTTSASATHAKASGCPNAIRRPNAASCVDMPRFARSETAVGLVSAGRRATSDSARRSCGA